MVNADDTVRSWWSAVVNDCRATLHPYPATVFDQKSVVLCGHLAFWQYFRRKGRFKMCTQRKLPKAVAHKSDGKSSCRWCLGSVCADIWFSRWGPVVRSRSIEWLFQRRSELNLKYESEPGLKLPTLNREKWVWSRDSRETWNSCCSCGFRWSMLRAVSGHKRPDMALCSSYRTCSGR